MIPFEKCPICGGRLQASDVEKMVRGGPHMATLQAPAELCRDCGERFYSLEEAERFEEIRHKLARGQVNGFRPLGQSFQVT